MNSINKVKKELSADKQENLLSLLKTRFEKNMKRHENIEWSCVETKLSKVPEKLWSINKMEETGGEPDVVGYDKETGELIFFDCSEETPDGRRNVCYDQEALETRKKYPPEDSALNMAEMMGIELLTEQEYFYLQEIGEFDTKTSSWLKTPLEVRKHGGAIFGDRRFGRVFIYHNGADSYYGARGFRGLLRV